MSVDRVDKACRVLQDRVGNNLSVQGWKLSHANFCHLEILGGGAPISPHRPEISAMLFDSRHDKLFVDLFSQSAENFCFIHVSLVPVLNVVGAQKTKPTQHSVRGLRCLGVIQNILSCRSIMGFDDNVKEKLSYFCHVLVDNIINLYDASNISRVSLILRVSSVVVVGNGCIAQDLQFQNTAGQQKHQAVALRVGEDQSVINRCKKMHSRTLSTPTHSANSTEIVTSLALSISLSMFLTYLSAICEDDVQGKKQLHAAINLLFHVPVSGSPRNNNFAEDQSETGDAMPALL
ncbi:hypothetical protein R3W88_033442 [Solanum pinnatisectum]|uniref:CTP synthase N-terminal domain-containing protein n=1 Tax=Solanum pinnatisectum TaxID=50273 RepID=A0AAV9K138_9SOLN|nr:hypothetical protein R3W88_033442 [Solanum pinnatisectum]